MSKTLVHRVARPVVPPETEWEKGIEYGLLNFSQAVSDALNRITHAKVKRITSDITIGVDTVVHGIVNRIGADASGGNITITFPPARLIDSVEFKIKKTDSSANTVTIMPASGETVGTYASWTITDQQSAFDISSNGDNLEIW